MGGYVSRKPDIVQMCPAERLKENFVLTLVKGRDKEHGILLVESLDTRPPAPPLRPSSPACPERWSGH